MKQTPSLIAEYADTAGIRLRNTVAGSGKQPGDPVRAAEAMIRITKLERPPRHLVLGAVAVELAMTKWSDNLAEVEQFRELGLSADFPTTAVQKA